MTRLKHDRLLTQRAPRLDVKACEAAVLRAAFRYLCAKWRACRRKEQAWQHGEKDVGLLSYARAMARTEQKRWPFLKAAAKHFLARDAQRKRR